MTASDKVNLPNLVKKNIPCVFSAFYSTTDDLK